MGKSRDYPRFDVHQYRRFKHLEMLVETAGRLPAQVRQFAYCHGANGGSRNGGGASRRERPSHHMRKS